ncbi:MAG: lysophospholipid acyltransferase family protein [Rhodanobacteraceae bacterium]
MPQFPQNPMRRFCAWLLRAAGWRLVGTLPDVPKLVLIAAPHSSWWDGVWGLLFRSALGADIAFMAKRELFTGPLGWLLRKAGGIPIERSSSSGVVEQMSRRFAAADKLWLGIAPEGTRKRVEKWKNGFWYIARAAGVPILPVYFDYPSRTIGLGPLFEPASDLDSNIAELRAFYAPFRGKHRGIA